MLKQSPIASSGLYEDTRNMKPIEASTEDGTSVCGILAGS